MDDGRALQIAKGARRSLPIRLGIDFGTAYTKMAIRVANNVFLVDWDGLHAGEARYLLSGELSETPAGDAFVGRSPDALAVLTDLKLPFVKLKRDSTIEDIAKAATFLAWTMKYARAWLYHHHASVLAGNQLIWEVNLGAPTGSWAVGTEELHQEYLRLGLTAWQLSQEERITVARGRALLATTIASESGAGLDALHVLPEFAAQIAEYVHSPQRQEGLHLLVDVGAGTLDVACFGIVRDDESGVDHFPVFASTVEPLGTHYLMRVREARCGGTDEDWEATHRVPDHATFAQITGVTADDVAKADQQFSALVLSAVVSVLTWTRHIMNRRAPEFGPRGNLPVFLAGGGAGVPAYREGVKAAFKKLNFVHRFRPFPGDGEVEARFIIDQEASNRLSVARGLTYDAEYIGKLIPTSDIPPDAPLQVRERIESGDLYT